MGGAEGDAFVEETKHALQADSPFWDFSEEAEEDAGNDDEGRQDPDDA